MPLDRDVLENKIVGGILGVIVGDALGLPVQFNSREEVRSVPVQGMRGYGTFNYPPGTWSDDGSLTLCLVESLCETGYNPGDLADRFLLWYMRGHWTPYGVPFDIGRATAEAMENLMDGADPLQAGPDAEHSNGNGALMRILPAVLYFASVPAEEMFVKVGAISRITHGHPRSQLACVLYALLVRELLAGLEPFPAYERMREQAVVLLKDLELARELPHFNRVLDGSLPSLSDEAIKSSGYVVDTLEAAIWCLLNGKTFTETLLAAVNLGEDTDTVGAVAGGLAGVHYGLSDMPEDWLKQIVRYEEILALAQRFASKI